MLVIGLRRMSALPGIGLMYRVVCVARPAALPPAAGGGVQRVCGAQAPQEAHGAGEDAVSAGTSGAFMPVKAAGTRVMLPVLRKDVAPLPVDKAIGHCNTGPEDLRAFMGDRRARGAWRKGLPGRLIGPVQAILPLEGGGSRTRVRQALALRQARAPAV